MLVSFHESYLLLVELCALFCVLTMFYSLYEHLTRGIRRKRQNRRAAILQRLLADSEKSQGAKREKYRKKLSHILQRPNGVLALTTALDEIGWEDSAGMDPVTRRILCELLTEKYIHIYQKEDEAVQGMLISLLIRCDVSSSRLKKSLLRNLEAKNLLVRIETMRYISAQRNRRLVLQVLESINRQPQYFSNKLLTDTLLEFQGDRKALMEELWENLAAYSQNIQIAVIEMLTVLREEAFAERICAVAKDPDKDKEIRIAALKYFQTVHRPEYMKIFVPYLTGPVWEYGAVVANVLRSYDCTGFFEQLLKGCASRNWYVRNNCARTIVACCSREQIERAVHVEDRYSKDSIRYVWETMEREEGLA